MLIIFFYFWENDLETNFSFKKKKKLSGKSFRNKFSLEIRTFIIVFSEIWKPVLNRTPPSRPQINNLKIEAMRSRTLLPAQMTERGGEVAKKIYHLRHVWVHLAILISFLVELGMLAIIPFQTRIRKHKPNLYIFTI